MYAIVKEINQLSYNTKLELFEQVVYSVPYQKVVEMQKLLKQEYTMLKDAQQKYITYWYIINDYAYIYVKLKNQDASKALTGFLDYSQFIIRKNNICTPIKEFLPYVDRKINISNL